MKTLINDLLETRIYNTRAELGEAAAQNAADYINSLLSSKEDVNIVFAAAPSQNEFLASLRKKDVDWQRINAFHMDEYIGIDKEAPQRFGNYLNEHIFSHVKMKSIHYLFGENSSPEALCEEYTRLLKEYPTDIIFMGIGENGHIAFNDPHEAFFDDPLWVKIVSLDNTCRTQQINDGCFSNIENVPLQAVTLTIPALMEANRIFCIVPAPSKANAILATVKGSITQDCPASILRRHKATTLYCDVQSADLLLKSEKEKLRH